MNGCEAAAARGKWAKGNRNGNGSNGVENGVGLARAGFFRKNKKTKEPRAGRRKDNGVSPTKAEKEERKESTFVGKDKGWSWYVARKLHLRPRTTYFVREFAGCCCCKRAGQAPLANKDG